MTYKDYINHNSFELSLKHKELPIVAQTGFDFYRYVTFTDGWKSTSHICGVSCKAEHQRQQPSRLYKIMRSFASCGLAFFFTQKTKIKHSKSLAHLCESDIITLIR